MLERLDRVILCSNDPDKVSGGWVDLLDAAISHKDKVACLNADRVTLNVGNCQVEVLSPDGEGVAREHLKQRSVGPFAAGFCCEDPERVARQLDKLGISYAREQGQLHLEGQSLGIPGLRLCISASQERESQGLLNNLYEVTHLTDNAATAAAQFAQLFDLDADQFIPINSDNYGYDGSLTLLDSKRLDRIETIHPWDPEKTMGRFFQRYGSSLYMCYGETDQADEIRRRLKTICPDDWTGAAEEPLDGLFIHPRALGGSMLGISRTTFAWSWSGYPERIAPLAPQAD